MEEMLSGKQIKDIVKTFGNPDILIYSRIPDQLFDNTGYFILYESQPMMGHWTLVYYNEEEDVWTFFDPYGIILDDELDFTYYDEAFKDDKPLSNLLFRYGDVFEINDIPFQKLAEGINTCGKWCVMKYLCYKLGFSDNWFNKKFRNLGDQKLDELFKFIFEK
jgi:hypothetical protein